MSKTTGVAGRVSVVTRAVETCTADIGTGFDVVFVDPPYADVQSGHAIAALERLLAGGTLAEGGLVVLEHSSRNHTPELKLLSCVDRRIYGDTAIALYR